MEETNDQVQADSPVSEPEAGPQVIKKDQATEEQSETTENVVEEAKPQVFTDHLGRELTAEQLHQEYMKTQGYISKLEKERLEWEKATKEEASKAVSESEHLKDVDPNVREAIVQIVTPVIEQHLRLKDAEAQKRAQDEAFTKRLDELESKYKGGNGLPKFDRRNVLLAMQDPTNSIYDPEWKFKQMHYADFLDYEIKQAMKGKSGTTETEATGSNQPRKPTSMKTPDSWEEAAKSAYSRI